MQTFSLTKWYLDCVDAEGRVAVAYWTEVAWHGLTICLHSLAVYQPGVQPVERSSTKAVPPPTNADGMITWPAAQLSCRLRCRSRVPVFSQRLLDRDDGMVDWRCESAHGDMIVECDNGETLRGEGYAECLSMTLPPWRLPIDTLRWGRWLSVSSDRSVVWIDWRGPHPLTAIFVDGQMPQAGVVGDERIEAGDAVLTLTEPHTIYSRSLSDTLGAVRPMIALLMPKSWLAVEDRKWRSRGTLRTAGRHDELGWVIHETVRWPS